MQLKLSALWLMSVILRPTQIQSTLYLTNQAMIPRHFLNSCISCQGQSKEQFLHQYFCFLFQAVMYESEVWQYSKIYLDINLSFVVMSGTSEFLWLFTFDSSGSKDCIVFFTVTSYGARSVCVCVCVTRATSLLIRAVHTVPLTSC